MKYNKLGNLTFLYNVFQKVNEGDYEEFYKQFYLSCLIVYNIIQTLIMFDVFTYQYVYYGKKKLLFLRWGH